MTIGKLPQNPEKIGAEQKEKEPEISYHFFYAIHKTAKDFEKLEQALQKTDIFVPETFRWTPLVKSFFQDVSQGRMPPEALLAGRPGYEKTSAKFRIFEIIHNSKKPILFADIPATDTELIKKDEEAIAFFIQAKSLFEKGDFQESLQKLLSYVTAFSKADIERENKIKENLKIEIKKFLQEHPEYLKKKELKVLISLGAGHTKIYHNFKKENLPVSREFSQSPYVYLSHSEADRRIVFNKKTKKELLAKSIIEEFLYPYLEKLTNDSVKIQRTLRKLSAKLTFKNIEQISKNFGKNPETNILAELKKLNIKIPSSEKAMNEILGIHSK